MASNSTAFVASTSHRLHKKRPSSTFTLQSRSLMDTYSNNAFSNNIQHTHTGSNLADEEPLQLERSIKRRYIMRPWSNAEQESLYIAVEKYRLYGQWHEVKTRMNLDRTAAEIEGEYTRLYAELPDSDEEWLMTVDDEQEQERELDHGASLPTPSLTATSSATPSARSSQDNMAILFDRSKSSSISFPKPTRSPDADEDDELEDDEDEGQQHHQNPQHFPTDTRPARMVRVWTLEQSENLKNLIEVYFPGAYRINWVWVAAQMGNAFTRKQCKNKWEIMRRRMGTEDEINLLKRGYLEFGPSWGQIQEKYLPERSRGGISIMWDLLETREAEQQQHPLKKSGPPFTRGLRHGRYHSTSSLRAFQRPGNSKESFTIGGTSETKHDQMGQHFRRKRTLTSDIEAMELSSTAFGGRPSMDGEKRSHQYRHMRHGSDATSLHSTETWSDRNYPMTWTEPLTRRLEELVHQHFPNHQKVNWVKVSSLMGNNPVVSRDQCKRRWYLISQNSNSSNSHHRQGELAAGGTGAMETDRTEDGIHGAGSPLGSL